jgi:hypothetical protein
MWPIALSNTEQVGQAEMQIPLRTAHTYTSPCLLFLQYYHFHFVLIYFLFTFRCFETRPV